MSVGAAGTATDEFGLFDAKILPNMEEAKRFLDRLAPNQEFTFQTFDDDKARADKRLTCLRHGSLEQLLPPLTSYQSKGAGVFVTLNQTDGRGRKKSNITRIRAIHQDDDTGWKGDYPLDPHVVVESSPGKFQRIWLVSGMTFDQHTRTMQTMVDRFGCDPNAKDLARVLRVPGFWHQKGEPFQVRIVEMSEEDPYPAEELMMAFNVGNNSAPAPEGKPETETPRTRDGIHPKVEKLAREAAQRTVDDATLGRHHAVIQLGHILRREKVPDTDENLDLALQVFEQNMRPCDTQGEIKPMNWPEEAKALRSAYRDPSAPDRPDPELPPFLRDDSPEEWLVHADLFCSNPPPPKWLIKKWLPESSLTMVWGPSGGGKSFLVIDWCCHLASGTPAWMGNSIKRKASVVYLAGEGHHGMRARMAAWKQHHQVQSLSMWISQSGCDLNTPEGYQKAADSIRELDEPPKLVVVDTLHRFFNGDENLAKDVKPMADACSNLSHEFGCAVVLVHHTGVANGERYRGSSAWKGALDMEYAIVPDTDSGTILIENKKNKDGETGFKAYFELQGTAVTGWLDEDGELVSSAIVIESSNPTQDHLDKNNDPHRIFTDAWYCSGKALVEGKPYLERSALAAYLKEHYLYKDRTIENKLAPKGDLIGKLSKEITKEDRGWIVSDPAWAAQIKLA